MNSSVFVATRSNLIDIQSTMDNGFGDDPTVQWIADTPELFASEHHRYVQLCAEPAFDHGGVHATVGFEGAAIWFPPGIGISETDYEKFKKTVHHRDRLEQFGEVVDACDQHRPEEPHWTLELIAVDPAAQNKGIGGKLMAFGLEICDRSEAPVYLASSNPLNLPFYERLGFVQVAEVSKPGVPMMYPMIRRHLK